jgi:hypothetical protein
VDVVIGTHRLLSNDVHFADLGLVIVDEEQRFGVEHKERLLRLRLTVDVLTLSATPIPRTLHMAMLGIRDISSLDHAAARSTRDRDRGDPVQPAKDRTGDRAGDCTRWAGVFRSQPRARHPERGGRWSRSSRPRGRGS